MAEKKFEGINMIKVEGSTECPGSGNSGETRIAWSNERATTWGVNILPEFNISPKFDAQTKRFSNPDFLEIILHGDHEARTFIESLEYMAEELRDQYQVNKKTKEV